MKNFIKISLISTTLLFSYSSPSMAGGLFSSICCDIVKCFINFLTPKPSLLSAGQNDENSETTPLVPNAFREPIDPDLNFENVANAGGNQITSSAAGILSHEENRINENGTNLPSELPTGNASKPGLNNYVGFGFDDLSFSPSSGDSISYSGSRSGSQVPTPVTPFSHTENRRDALESGGAPIPTLNLSGAVYEEGDNEGS